MRNQFDSDWDPYQQLLAAEHNIGQLVMAVQHSSLLIEQLAKEAKNQNRIIGEILIQNRKLNNLLNLQQIKIETINLDLSTLIEKRT